MGNDISFELDLIYWEAWFMGMALEVPQGKDSAGCHSYDTLSTWVAGGEL